MLLHDDVVSDGQAKACALSSRFCCEEWIEHLFPYFRRNAATVVANRNRHAVAKVLRRSCKSRLIAIATVLFFALGCRIEAVGDQVQESPRDFLWEYVNLAGGWIQGPLDIDLEALILRAGSMIGEI